MVSNRTVKSIRLAINMLTVEKGVPEVIFSDKESAVVSMSKIQNIQDDFYKKYGKLNLAQSKIG